MEFVYIWNEIYRMYCILPAYFAQGHDLCPRQTFNLTTLRRCLRMSVGSTVSGNTESLNYAGFEGICDHTRLKMLL